MRKLMCSGAVAAAGSVSATGVSTARNSADTPPIPMSRRDLFALLGAAALAASSTQVRGQSMPKRGGTLKVSAAANPSSLDPFTGGAGSDHTFLWTMFDTLVEWDYETLKAKPGMAEWTFADPLTMVLKIKPGITFHDGTPMDAQAVKFNLDRGRQAQRSSVKADLSSIASIAVNGPLQLTLKLSSPDTAMPAILSDRAGMMVSPKAVEQFGNDHDRNAVGAGPWKLVAWTDHQKVSLVRYDKYWRSDRGFLDGIDFSIIPERATGLRAVVAGQNDMIYGLPPRLKSLVEKAPDLTLVTGPTLYFHKIWFNLARKPLDNIKVRQAINCAVDRETFLKAGFAGVGEVALMPLPSNHWAYEPELAKLYPHDLSRARTLLEEAGFKDGVELTVGRFSDQDATRRGEILQEQLSKAGIRLKFTHGTVAEISAGFFEKKYDMMVSAWTGRPDPAMTFGLMYQKDAYFNAGRVEVSPDFTALLKECRAVENLDERKKVFSKIQRIVMEQALLCPLSYEFEMVAHSKRVKGYKPNLLGKSKYEFISLS